MSEEYSIEDFRYLRTGYISDDRDVDVLVAHLVEQVPGDGVLPPRWRWGTQERFLTTYGDPGPVIWSKTASFHMLMLNGMHTFRLWTDSATTCVVDLADGVAAGLKSKGVSVEDIPESCDRKCKPLTQRCRMSTTKDIDLLIETVEHIYGVSIT